MKLFKENSIILHFTSKESFEFQREHIIHMAQTCSRDVNMCNHVQFVAFSQTREDPGIKGGATLFMFFTIRSEGLCSTSL